MKFSNNFLWFVFLLGWIVSLGLMLGITFYWQPKVDQAYERGYEDARSVLLDTLYNRWLNDSLGWGSIDSTEKGWYGWEISEALARSWYDGVDSTHTTYEDAIQDWVISHLLKERKFIIYFDSTDTLEDLLDWYGWEVPTIPAGSWIKGVYLPAIDPTDTMPAVEQPVFYYQKLLEGGDSIICTLKVGLPTGGEW